MPTPVFSRVLVGWDGSRSAATGLKVACQITAFPGGRVTALSVVPSFSHIEADDDRARALSDARQPLLAAYQQIVATLTLHPQQQVRLRFAQDEHVATALDQFVAEQVIDLLVVGLHGREGVLHPRMGHIAGHVVKSSSCPVLVIPEAPPAGMPRHDEPAFAGAARGLFHLGHRHTASACVRVRPHV
jgi:nucleotide-binding universal stress UspA family protein